MSLRFFMFFCIDRFFHIRTHEVYACVRFVWETWVTIYTIYWSLYHHYVRTFSIYLNYDFQEVSIIKTAALSFVRVAISWCYNIVCLSVTARSIVFARWKRVAKMSGAGKAATLQTKLTIQLNWTSIVYGLRSKYVAKISLQIFRLMPMTTIEILALWRNS